jgi:hypothetical protein
MRQQLAVFPFSRASRSPTRSSIGKEDNTMSDTKRPAQESVPRGTKVNDDAQATSNEAQQSPANSGDPRTSNAVGVPLPYGGQSDSLHPITQPSGDLEDPANDVGIRRIDQCKKSA